MLYQNRFSEKVAVVTGGASGIGKAIVERFVDEGGRVAVVDIDGSAMKAIRDALGQDKVFIAECDIADKLQVEKAVDAIIEHFGQIDCLFNVAAITYRKPLIELEEDQFDRTMRVNVKGTVNMTQAVANKMIENDIQGSIVNFASRDALMSSSANPTYATSKGAVMSFTRTAAVSLIPYGIRVNTMVPGFTDTPFTAPTIADKEKFTKCTAGIPMKRIAQPEEQAGPALFLASDDASYVVGAQLVADGGCLIAQ